MPRYANQSHSSENKTRIIKIQSLDGEFILLARRNIDNANVFVQYGFGETRTANFSGGGGVQEAEFVDGLRFSVQSAQPMRMNVDLKFGVDKSLLREGIESLYAYTWVVNTTNAQNASLGKADIIFPINQNLLAKIGGAGSVKVIPAKRPLGAASSRAFEVMYSGGFGEALKVIRVAGVQGLDGEYILLVEKAAGGAMMVKPAEKDKEEEGRIGKVAGEMEDQE